MRDSRAGRGRNGLALLLLLAALLVRAAIPQGYMAQSSEPGVLTVTLCHSDAVWRIPLTETGESPGKSADPEPQPCVFAGYGPALLAVEPQALPLPASVAGAFARAEAPFALEQAARQLPPARAPPWAV